MKATPAAATNSRNSVVVSALEEDHNREVVEAEGVVGRRAVLAATSALSFAGLLGGVEGAVAGEDVISDWEQVTLPVNPGVVLLDLAFVPEQPQRGLFSLSLSFLSFENGVEFDRGFREPCILLGEFASFEAQ